VMCARLGGGLWGEGLLLVGEVLPPPRRPAHGRALRPGITLSVRTGEMGNS
jgi:hypothetical protein